jgi:hypothetical protein
MVVPVPVVVVVSVIVVVVAVAVVVVAVAVVVVVPVSVVAVVTVVVVPVTVVVVTVVQASEATYVLKPLAVVKSILENCNTRGHSPQEKAHDRYMLRGLKLTEECQRKSAVAESLRTHIGTRGAR